MKKSANPKLLRSHRHSHGIYPRPNFYEPAPNFYKNCEVSGRSAYRNAYTEEACAKQNSHRSNNFYKNTAGLLKAFSWLAFSVMVRLIFIVWERDRGGKLQQPSQGRKGRARQIHYKIKDQKHRE